jgi:hypothetical protein
MDAALGTTAGLDSKESVEESESGRLTGVSGNIPSSSFLGKPTPGEHRVTQSSAIASIA